MPTPFEDFAMPADLTARFYPVRPGTGRRLTTDDGEVCWIELVGWSSSVAQEHRFAREETLRRTGRLLTPQEEWHDGGDMLAKMTKAWQLVAPTGRRLEVECNFDNARVLWNDVNQRWLRLQAIAFLDNEGNFAPPGWRS